MSGAIKINGTSSGSTTITAPASGGDRTLTAPDSDGTLATQAYAATAGGLVLVDSRSISAASSVSLDNVFSSAYDNYRIMFHGTNSGSGVQVLSARLRAAGSDISTNVYYASRIYWTNAAGPTRDGSNWGQSSWTVFALLGDQDQQATVDLFNPFVASLKRFSSISGASAAADNQFTMNQGQCQSTAQADGITLTSSSGNITGTLRVYGYADA